MPKSSASWSKGETGNPSGRPKGKSALSECLKAIGSATFSRKKTSRNEALAMHAWDLAITGKTQLTDGMIIRIESFQDWFSVIRWLADRCDGKPFQMIDEDTEARLQALEARSNGKH